MKKLTALSFLGVSVLLLSSCGSENGNRAIPNNDDGQYQGDPQNQNPGNGMQPGNQNPNENVLPPAPQQNPNTNLQPYNPQNPNMGQPYQPQYPNGGGQPYPPQNPNMGQPYQPQYPNGGGQPYPPQYPNGNGMMRPPMQDPNIGLLPPQGQPMQYPLYENYFGGLRAPYGMQPVFPQPYANQWANYCWQRRIDLRAFNQAFYFFSTIQVQQNAVYRPLWDGNTAIRITTAVLESQQGFNVAVFQQYYYQCLQQGFYGQMAVQQAFRMMNIRIDVREYIVPGGYYCGPIGRPCGPGMGNPPGPIGGPGMGNPPGPIGGPGAGPRPRPY